MSERWYTVANHFHWADMQWMWGNGVVAESIRDLVDFLDATGAVANLNVDGVGYERLAAEDPRAIESLRAEIAGERIEVVGGTYGQPYGLFHPGESAIRQFGYGIAAVQRLLGHRPRAFWEEEFCFFPQLPQILHGCGYDAASVFFQWTWHTPHVPVEEIPAIWWEGIDGSRIVALPKTATTIHQWPEDVAETIRSGQLRPDGPLVVQQWLELLPSPDWMCRSELVAPAARDLLDALGPDARVGTLSRVAEALKDHAQPRQYAMGEVFHGMSLGKNGSGIHRASHALEDEILSAETASVLTATLGRPYPQWGYYPFWELEEAWRELLAFQHHDNDECEGLCGHVGFAGAHRGTDLARHVRDRAETHLARGAARAGRGGLAGGDSEPVPAPAPANSRGIFVAVNTLGWSRPVVHAGHRHIVPAYAAVPLVDGTPVAPVTVDRAGGGLRLARTGFEASFAADGALVRVGDVELADCGGLTWRRGGATERFSCAGIDILPADESSPGPGVAVRLTAGCGAELVAEYRIAPETDALDLRVRGTLAATPDPGALAALRMPVRLAAPLAAMVHDTPYAVGPVTATHDYPRKYPTGDWMTSPQYFETVDRPFTGLQFVDLRDRAGHGLLWCHCGTQGFHGLDDGMEAVLTLNDPWDEEYFVPDVDLRVRLVPHGPIGHAECWRLAQEHRRPVPVRSVAAARSDAAPPDAASSAVQPESAPPAVLPTSSSPVPTDVAVAFLDIAAPRGVVATALFRESPYLARDLAEHVDHLAPEPILLRLVDFDGLGGPVTVRPRGTLERAWRTSPLGEVRAELPVTDGAVRVDVGPYRIETVALDVREARSLPRNLDEHRSTWATIHREADQ